MHTYSRVGETICSVLIMILVFAVTQQSLAKTELSAEVSGHKANDTAIIVVLGLADSLNSDVKRAIETELADKNLSIIDLANQSLPSIDWPEQALVVAAGVVGCEQAVTIARHLDVRCVLLTEENFKAIRGHADVSVSRSLSALVIDQPIARQAQVAQSVYPALSRFAVLSETLGEYAAQDNEGFSLNLDLYRPTLPLARQLSDALVGNDALIAIPQTSVYSRETLRTVLLTAYGYAKPVIGLSRAYVKAGALITAYSTPAQVFREVADGLHASNNFSASAVSYPRYFSVADNVNVAKSLGLTKIRRFDVDHTFTDRDFQP